MRRALLASLSLIALAACSESRETANAGFSNSMAQSERNLGVRRGMEAYRGPINVRTQNGVWLGEAGVRNNNGTSLPPELETRSGVTINIDRPLSLDQVASRLSEITKIRHSVEGVAAWQGNSSGAAAPAADAGLGIAGLPGPAFDSSLGSVTASFGGLRPQGITLKYNGTLTGLLNQVANHFEVDWEYRDGAVRFLGLQTKQFTLQAMNTEVETNTQIQSANSGTTGSSGGSGGGGGGGGGGTQNTTQGTTSKVSVNYWASVEATIKSMLPEGTAMALNANAGTITITARPSILRQVENYVRAENRRLARQVAVEVKVLSIEANDNDNYNANLSVLFRDVASGLNLAFNGPGAAATGLTNSALVSAGIVSGTRQGQTLNSFAGSQAFVQALSARTNASLVTSTSTTALNNQVAPISVLNTRGYLARRTQTQVEGSSSPTVSLEPGTLNTGFSMSVLPRIFSNGEIMMNYNISIAEQVGDFQQVGTADNFIQVPNVNSRALNQSVRIRSGDTLVLGGFERVRTASTDSGAGKPTFRLFGGGMQATNTREMLVILITPVILESGNAQIQAAQQ